MYSAWPGGAARTLRPAWRTSTGGLAAVGRGADDLLNDVGDLLGCDGAFATDRRLELLENLGRLKDGRFFSADVDLVVASGNLSRDAVANAA